MVEQADNGLIYLFDDFFSGYKPGATVADNNDVSTIGPFMLFGQGIDEADAGALVVADALNGAVRLTTTDEAAHTAAVGTQAGFKPSSMGPLTLEARVQSQNLDTKTMWVGFSNDAAITAVSPVDGCTVTLTLNDADLAGFVLDASLTEDEMWHYAYKGGTAAASTSSSAVQTCVCAVAGEYDILRVEIDPNGTVSWFVNGSRKARVENAVCKDEVFAGYVMVQSHGCAIEDMDVDYLRVSGSRDWSV